MELINLSELEVTEIYEDESMAVFLEGKTVIDIADVWRVAECKYKLKQKEKTGTKIHFYEFESIVVSDDYDKLEQIRRKYKSDLIVKSVCQDIQVKS